MTFARATSARDEQAPLRRGFLLPDRDSSLWEIREALSVVPRHVLTGIARAMIRTVAGPSGIEVGFWGTIQKFAIAGAKHQGTEKHRAQVQNSYADYRRWLAEEMGADAL